MISSRNYSALYAAVAAYEFRPAFQRRGSCEKSPRRGSDAWNQPSL